MKKKIEDEDYKTKYAAKMQAFPVKICSTCGIVYQNEQHGSYHLKDFPRIGLEKVDCIDCKKSKIGE